MPLVCPFNPRCDLVLCSLAPQCSTRAVYAFFDHSAFILMPMPWVTKGILHFLDVGSSTQPRTALCAQNMPWSHLGLGFAAAGLASVVMPPTEALCTPSAAASADTAVSLGSCLSHTQPTHFALASWDTRQLHQWKCSHKRSLEQLVYFKCRVASIWPMQACRP